MKGKKKKQFSFKSTMWDQIGLDIGTCLNKLCDSFHLLLRSVKEQGVAEIMKYNYKSFSLSIGIGKTNSILKI